MVWIWLLLLTMATPLLRMVSPEPLFENAPAVGAKTIFRTSQARSVTGVKRVLPSKTMVAVPLFSGGNAPTQFDGVLQLLSPPRPFQVENAGGTISPDVRRIAPAE